MDTRLRDQSESRMMLIRKLIGLAFTYSDKELFYQKFKECINIVSLKESGIMETGWSEITAICGEELSNNEIELYRLIQQGFTPQEMAVILGEKSVNAIYIMRHRLKKKLNGQASPEAVFVMMILCIIALLLLTSFGM